MVGDVRDVLEVAEASRHLNQSGCATGRRRPAPPPYVMASSIEVGRAGTQPYGCLMGWAVWHPTVDARWRLHEMISEPSRHHPHARFAGLGGRLTR